ncbi:MAG: hypothetical protein SFU85_07435 [Candidatus Methylacidiphilales bacterium]|nr:hypothetical protein [Candidatus Methylacidiphilales bacterium]
MSEGAAGPAPENEADLVRRRQEFFASMHTMGLQGCDADEIPGAQGEFGHEITNPIPTNTYFGSDSYLSRLRTEDGAHVKATRAGTAVSPACPHPVDVYAISKQDGTPLATLYLSPHNQRNSDKAPRGFMLQPTIRIDGRAFVGICDPPLRPSRPPKKPASGVNDPNP